MQKLKKKAHLKTEDEVFIFYEFHNAEYLNEAIKSEYHMIANAVKKPMFSMEFKDRLIKISSDEGVINGENYKIVITHPHLMMDLNALKVINN